MAKRVIGNYEFQRPDEKNQQLITESVDVVLERVRGGYLFRAGDKNVKIEDVEEFDAKTAASELALENPEEAEKFIQKLAWLYRVAPEKKIRLPDIEFGDFNNKVCVAIGLSDVVIFVEKKKT